MLTFLGRFKTQNNSNERPFSFFPAKAVDFFEKCKKMSGEEKLASLETSALTLQLFVEQIMH